MKKKVKKKKIKKKQKTDEEKEEDGGEGLQVGDTEVIAHKSQSSVTIKKDAKGKVSFELKAYADDINVARLLAIEEYESLVQLLPVTDSEEE